MQPFARANLHTYLLQVPRGVIDLDPYTDIGVDQSTGAIVLGPGTGDTQGLRNFYFRPEDRQTMLKTNRFVEDGATAGEEEGRRGVWRDLDGGGSRLPRDGRGEDGGEENGGGLGEWLSGLHRERYKVVRDERDAYMNLQVKCLCRYCLMFRARSLHTLLLLL